MKPIKKRALISARFQETRFYKDLNEEDEQFALDALFYAMQPVIDKTEEYKQLTN